MVQWLGLGAFTDVAQVQSLVRELRSHKLRGTAKTNKKQKKQTQNFYTSHRSSKRYYSKEIIHGQ